MYQNPPALSHTKQRRRAVAIAQTNADGLWSWYLAFLLAAAWAALALLIL